MAIYLYCLTEPGCEPPAGLRGIAGGAVRAVDVAGRLAAWVSDLPDEPGPATTEQAKLHDRVVRAALARETPLPARFGQSFVGEAALRGALEARVDQLESSLARLRGGVEMTVRILLPRTGKLEGASGAPSSSTVGAGRAYMARLRERQRASAELLRQAEFLQARVTRAVDGFTREEVCSPVMPEARSFSVSHLVAREAVGEYRLAVDSLMEADPALRLLVSGPWAPYSFARVADE